MLFCFILTFRTFQSIENNFTFEDIFKHFFSHLSTFVFIIEHLVLHLQRENITTFKMRNVNHLQYKDEHKHLMLFTSSLTVLKFIPNMLASRDNRVPSQGENRAWVPVTMSMSNLKPHTIEGVSAGNRVQGAVSHQASQAMSCIH